METKIDEKSFGKYSKEVLVKYILSRIWVDRNGMIKELDSIRQNIEFEKLMKRSEEIRISLSKIHISKSSMEGIHKFVKLTEEDNIIHLKINKILGVEVNEN